MNWFLVLIAIVANVACVIALGPIATKIKASPVGFEVPVIGAAILAATWFLVRKSQLKGPELACIMILSISATQFCLAIAKAHSFPLAIALAVLIASVLSAGAFLEYRGLWGMEQRTFNKIEIFGIVMAGAGAIVASIGPLFK